MKKLVLFSNLFIVFKKVNFYNFCNNLFLFSFVLLISSFPVRGSNLPESFADLVEQLSPAVVNITTTAVVPEREQFNPMFHEDHRLKIFLGILWKNNLEISTLNAKEEEPH